MTHTPIRCLLVAGLVLTAVVGAAPAGVTAEDPDDEQPILPLASYYGQVTIDGEPAPAGTTITALVDGERRGSITLTEAGRLGSPDGPGSDLVVSGPEAAVGSTVTFLVDGERAQVTTGTATIESATPRRQQVALSIGAAESPSESPSSGSDDENTDRSSGDSEPDESDTESTTADQSEAESTTPAVNASESEQSADQSNTAAGQPSADSGSDSSASESKSESESEADSEDASGQSTDGADETPGFGVVLAIFVLSAAVVALRQRTQQ